MGSSSNIDPRTFLAHLRQSGLISTDQLEGLRTRLPDNLSGRALARALVNGGLLTRFQAEQLLAGRTSGFFLGQYRILEQLGQGGMGRVYKAEHRTMGRVVALKVLAPTLVKTERAQELFLREVRAAALLVHPNIVTAFDAGQGGDRCYLVMEYVNGPNLEQLVRDKGPLPIGQACDFVRQAALGLQYAHQLGLVHRDVKPANLLLHRVEEGGRTCGVVKVSDFGLARLGDRGGDDPVGTILTRPNSVMGTPDYLSPEQARSLHKTDIRSDLYSLGCTFHYLLTGKVPFPGGTTLEKLLRHSSAPPTPVNELRPSVPAAVAALVARLMAKDPVARFQTPAELAEALEPFAVASAPSWSGVRRALPRTELSRAARLAGVLPVPDEPDAMAALTPTLREEESPTPLPEPEAARPSRRRAGQRQRRLKLALIWTIGILGGLVALGAAVALLLGAG